MAPPSPDLFRSVYAPEYSRWRAGMTSLALHALLLVVLPRLWLVAFALDRERFDWNAYEIQPLRLALPEPLYLPSKPKVSAPARPQGTLGPRPARPAKLAASPGKPSPQIETPLPPPRIPAAVTVLQLHRTSDSLLAMIPQLAAWADTPPRRPTREFIAPGHRTPPQAVPQLTAPPRLEVPNREPLMSDISLATLPALANPALPRPPSSAAPIRQPGGAEPRNAPIEPLPGEPAHVIAFGSAPPPLTRLIIVPPVTQAAASGQAGSDAQGGEASSGKSAAGSSAGKPSAAPPGSAARPREGQPSTASASEPPHASEPRPPTEPRPQGSGRTPVTEPRPPAEPRPSGSGPTPVTEPQPSTEPRPSGSGPTPVTEPRPSGGGPPPSPVSAPAPVPPPPAAAHPPDSRPSLPSDAVRITRPRDGRFAVIVTGSSSSEAYPETRNALSGRIVYTVYLRVGARKDWILQYCAVESGAGGGTAPLEPPFPFVIVRPRIAATLDVEYLVVHGIVNRAGGFEQLSVIGEIPQAVRDPLLASLRQWELRPATRDGVPVPVEILLIIPREAI